MGPQPLDSLLAPARVAVVGTPDDATPATDVYEPTSIVSDAVEASLAVVTTAERIDETVPTLVEAGADVVVVTVAVPDETWFPLVERATAADVALLGPTASVALPHEDIQAGVDEHVTPGNVAIVGHDAPTVAALLAEGAHRKLGVSAAVATGEHPTHGPAAVVDLLEDHAETSVVLARPDRIGRAFVETAAGLSPDLALAVHAPKWACADEPVAVGDLTVAPARLRDAVLAQAGVLAVDSVDRLLDLAPALAEQPLPDGDEVVIASNAGGPGVMATDAVGTSRLSMAELADETVEALQDIIPERAFARNPLDLLADSDIDVFRGVVDVVLDDPAVDSVVVISAPNPILGFDELAEMVADARGRHDAPIVTALMGGESTASAADTLRTVGVPNYFDPFQAVQVIAALADQRDAAERRRERQAADTEVPALDDRDASGGALAPVSSAGVSTDRRAGVSLSVGVRDVAGLGPVVAVGLEEYAAVLEDVAVRLAPVDEADVDAMLDELRAGQLLTGARGTEAVDVAALVDAIRTIAAIPAATDVEGLATTVVASADGVSVTAADYQ
ncbi:MAG: acetate--CoA ligase family protein [Halanaeroarchaeum sp.]